jgi:spartin
MGNAVGLVGDSVRNVGVVYIDARGVGRRALLRVAGKRMVKGRMGGKDVIFRDQGLGRGVVMEKGASEGGGGGGGGGPPGSGSGYSGGYGPPPFAPPNASMPGSYSNSKMD